MKTEVDLVEFKGGNVGSVQRCLHRLNIPFRTVNQLTQPDGTRPLLVPGVGSFGGVMNALGEGGLATTVKSLVQNGTPFIGICVGMQILFERSEESPETAGMGILRGEVVRFNAPKVPLIGWTEINAEQDSFADGYVYFVNSFFPKPQDPEAVLYSSEYAGKFCAAVRKDHVTGFQFHPEKSGAFGSALLQRSIEDACRN